MLKNKFSKFYLYLNRPIKNLSLKLENVLRLVCNGNNSFSFGVINRISVLSSPFVLSSQICNTKLFHNYDTVFLFVRKSGFHFAIIYHVAAP